MSKWFVALGVLASVFLLPGRASATVTATFSITGPNPLNTFCPVNVGFTGSINGPAGTVVKYDYSHFVNGSSTISPTVTATIPANGSLPVSETLNIDLAHSGFQSNEVDVTSPQVASGKVFFTVNCVPNLPPPPLVFPPPAPTALSNTTDPPTCTAHAGLGGGLACLAGINAGMLALIWNWSPSRFVKSVDGYKVYRVDGSQHTLVSTQNNGTDVTLALLNKPSDGFNGKCYVVTAYKGKSESSDSGFFCAGNYQGGTIVENFTLTPSNTRTVDHHYNYVGYGPGCGLSSLGTGPRPGLWVGFIHGYSSSGGFTCSEDTFVDQTAVGFNLGGVGVILRNPKASVQSARFLFKKLDSGADTCLAGIHLPNGDWSNAQDLIPNSDFISGLPWSVPGVSFNSGQVKISGANFSIDVASLVNDWAKGNRPNNGLLLIGGNEDTSGYHDNNVCDSQFGSFALSIQVLISP